MTGRQGRRAPSGDRHRPVRASLRTAVLAASGCAGTGRELQRFTDIGASGPLITRSITTEPRAGARVPRLVETPSGLVNALGLPGPGSTSSSPVSCPWLLEQGATVVVSLVGASARRTSPRLAQRLRQVDGVAAIEVNLSNPVAGRPAPLAVDAGAAAGVVHPVRRNTATGVPVFAKLAGDATDVVAVARVCVTAGADGLSLINAVRRPSDRRETRPARWAAVIGGLSGPAIKPIALRAVWQVHAALPDGPDHGQRWGDDRDATRWR